MQTLADIGEFGWIQRLQSILSPGDDTVILGVGDDAAVFMPRRCAIVVSTDAMVQDVHFRLEWSTPADLAHKALASSLSDLAAKAAEPAYTVISAGLPGTTPVEWMERFYETLAQKALDWKTHILGGDTVAADQLWFSITVWGYQTTSAPIPIHSAQPGDRILVTGYPGDAAGGLQFLQHKSTSQSPEARYLVQRFLCPAPRLDEAVQIASIVTPNAMTDISDGMSRDLKKICAASRVGARLNADRFPVSAALSQLYLEEAQRLVWQGGEDYELLLTLSEPDTVRLLKAWNRPDCPLTVVGEITEEADLVAVQGLDIQEMSGYDHFQRGSR